MAYTFVLRRKKGTHFCWRIVWPWLQGMAQPEPELAQCMGNPTPGYRSEALAKSGLVRESPALPVKL